MSLRNVPSEEEVMGWNPQSLAHYMRKPDNEFVTPCFRKACAKEEEAWGSDDSDNGNVYESFDKDDKAEDYICSPSELQTVEKQHGAKTCKANYMQENYARPMKPPKLERNAAVQDCHKVLYSDLKIANIKKPELPSTSLKPTKKSKGGIVLPPRLSSVSLPQPHATSNRMNRLPPVPLIATKPVQEKKSIPEPTQMKTQSSDMLMGRHNLHVVSSTP
ncbi:uncharacterized protein LOC121642797 [Melanotaenia boesemani]|uniref:uncharacterized protein LOC121642797 n=1 Tax=Melanotaenia boesemani TaxID=1250792 RepID=UPI001C03A43B|nr:uncharacterized protein LOC121642797 [Melanotaenia boesemani]